MGYGLVIILFIFALMLNQFGSVLLLKSKNLSRHSNYATIFYEVWRSKLSKGLGSILIFINNIGICKSKYTQVLHNSSSLKRRSSISLKKQLMIKKFLIRFILKVGLLFLLSLSSKYLQYLSPKWRSLSLWLLLVLWESLSL